MLPEYQCHDAHMPHNTSSLWFSIFSDVVYICFFSEKSMLRIIPQFQLPIICKIAHKSSPNSIISAQNRIKGGWNKLFYMYNTQKNTDNSI